MLSEVGKERDLFQHKHTTVAFGGNVGESPNIVESAEF